MTSLENISKVRTYLGFAIKANKAVFGIDSLERTRKAPRLVLIDRTVGADTKKRAEAYSKKHGAELVDIENFSELCSRAGVKVIGIKEPNLAEAILKTLQAHTKKVEALKQ